MSDFDFDELDKAVTGALNADEPSTEGQSSQPTPPLAQNYPSKPVEQPVDTPMTPVSRPAPAARRSSGRFMDVVHPSSDMRTGSPVSPRETTNEPAPRTTFVPPVPSPLEPQVSSEPENVVSDAEKEFEANWSSPLESPFLPDAKVEKVPLGSAFPTGPSDAVPAQDAELQLEEPDEPRLEATTMPDPIDFAEQSDTFDARLEKIEQAEEVALEIPSEEPIETPKATPDFIFESNEPQPEVAAEKAPEPVPVAPIAKPEPETATGPTSITQQYEERPSTPQQSGAIYDTETYHRPVAPVATKSNGIWPIIWIILLIILGAGAGVAFYFFVLPML